ncbi:MAG: flagellin FliC [Oligoflexia bacterium]|nr:flagellin FliC [Oligoflexia bacterium]MBF0364812.1 flagellin FliC [Oligoflexia bacterium]
MGLRILTNVASQEVQRNLRAVSQKADTELSRLSSGKRITKSADDAAGLAISTNLDAQTRGLRQATRNANDGISLVQTAEGGLNEITNILVRLRELTVQGASDTVGDAERGLLNSEFQSLVQEVDRISEATTFNGTSLLNGNSGKGTLEFHVGAFAGEQNKIIFDADATNASADNIGISGLTIEAREDAAEAISSLDGAITNVSSLRAGLGATQSRLQSTVSNLEIQTINQDGARSVIQDVDVAQATANLASANVLKAAGVSTLVQANNIPTAALRLIG